jgi:hypothetical protein
MKPTYFPFTYIPESVGKALAAYFVQTAVYQISGGKIPDDMQNLVKDGILDIRIPIEIDGELLDNIYKEYRLWINTHQGTETAFLKTMAHKIPFFAEDASSQIRAELKKTTRQIPSQERPDPLFNAGLFLHMAQEYDLQNERLSRDLMDIDAMEEDLMKDLKGENDNDQARTTVRMEIERKDPGLYMTTERMEAWASMMLKDPQDSGLFITTSRAALELLMDILPESQKVIRFDVVSVSDDEDEVLSNWRNILMEALEILSTENRPAVLGDMAAPPEVPGSETKVSLTLYMVPDKTPHECFAGCVAADVSRADSTKTSTHFKNTLIGLVETSG